MNYRLGVYALIIDRQDNFLIIQKHIYKDKEWTFIGGGRENGESMEDNLFREINEETKQTKDNFDFIGVSNYKIEYLYPKDISKKINGGKYQGQSYQLVLVRFKGRKEDLKFNEEIRLSKWVKGDKLKEYLIFPDQYKNALAAIKEISPELIKRKTLVS